MSDLPVIITPAGEADARRIDAWWRENRQAAPNLFLDEFALAVSLIASFPALGKRYRGAAVAGLRRYLLRSTRFHIYYVHTKTQVTILTIWGAVRGTTPDVQRLLDEFRSRKA